MELKQLTRQFIVDRGGEKITIEDPNPSYSLSEVAEFLSNDYPELLNARFEGPTTKDDKLTYELSKTFGTKG